MDPLMWLVLLGIFGLTLLVALYFQMSGGITIKKDKKAPAPRGGGQGAVVAGGMRRTRNIRARVAAVQRARGQVETIPEDPNEEGGESGGEEMHEGTEEENQKVYSGKIGTKKLKKIQEKAEKKALREQEEAMREDRKKREALREEERKQEYEAELELKKKQEEEEACLKEEQEKREHEEYLAMKQAFVVEDEGQGANEDEETKGVQDFIDHIRKSKVVYMEELAAEFNLKTQDAIDRVQSLQEDGELTGVIDDRGKFIYVSQEELQAVATFIKQRGRVSIVDLVTSSNTLINLQPETDTLTL